MGYGVALTDTLDHLTLQGRRQVLELGGGESERGTVIPFC